MTSIIDSIKGAEAMENLPIINPDFENLLDIQTAISYDELKKLILKDGMRDPVVVWKEKNTLVDGHNRLKIAKELGIPCRGSRCPLPTRPRSRNGSSATSLAAAT